MKAAPPLPAPGVAALLLATLVSSVFAQSLPEAPPPTPADEPVALSPFIVSSETERGYQATETLAGMRIRQNLKDAGAAIDVLTEEFLNDVGVVDMNDALKYVANMQYADFPSPSDSSNAAQWFSASFISRGVVGNTVLTDFFPTGSVPIDRYNTDNLTLMRGPNAILFGIGSPSGIVGASTKRARMGRPIHSVRFLVDDNGTHRGELDVSRMLIDNKLAFRVAALYSDKSTYQDPSMDRRKALYGTVTYRPWARTTITVNGEKGTRDRIHVQNHIAMDAYTPWVLAGSPLVTSRIGFPATGAAYSTAVGSGLQNQSTGTYLVHIQGSGLPVMDWRGMARGSGWANTLPTGAPGSGLILSADRGLMDNIGFNAETTIIPLEANVYGGLNRNDLEYEVKSIFLEQNLWRDLDIELAWNEFESDYLFRIHAYSNNAKIFVDPNVYLPDGSVNPYAGMPYVETGTGGNAMRNTGSLDKYTTKRATLSYQLNLDHHKLFRNLGFGNYRFGGLYQDADSSQKLLATRIVNVTPLPGNATANPLNNNQNRVSRRYYLQPGEYAFQLLDPLTFNQPVVPGTPAANVGPVNLEERMSDEAPRNSWTNTESIVAAIQTAWWASRDDSYHHLTGLYGWREDTETRRAQSFTRNAQGEFGVPVTPRRAYHLIEQHGVWNDPDQITVHTKSYNVTYRPISPVRLFYNYSDIFRAAAVNFNDVRGNPLRPAFGETEDYGVKLDLFDERVFLSVTKYETGVVDTSTDNTGNLREPINQLLNAIQQNGNPSASDAQVVQRELDNLIRPFTYRDDTTEGYEASLTANITRNWNARVTYGTQKTIISKTFDEWVPYFEEFRPFWQGYSTVPLVNTAAGYTTVADAIARANQRLIDQRSIIGQQPTDQRSRNSSLATTYRFSEGRLKGFRVGGGYRWRSANVLGYARDADGNLDRDRPFRGEEEFTMDLNLGYSRKLWNNKITWDIQLNIYNLLNGDEDIKARQAVDNGRGEPIIVRTYLAEPRMVQLTNSISF